jgi:hypothetical protein
MPAVRWRLAPKKKMCEINDLLAGAPGFEPGNDVTNYAFEMSREFPWIQQK